MIQKNPGFSIPEMIEVKNILCNSLNIKKENIIIKNLLPGLYSIEKR